MLRRTSRGAVHLVLGGAAAAALVGILVGIVVTVLRTQSVAARIPLVLLGVAALVLICRLLSAPQVRPAEVSFANLFLDTELEDVGESRDRRSRLDGAIWALIAMIVGGLALFLLLLLVPAGITLMVAPLLGEPLRIGGRDFALTGAMPWLLVPAGVLLVLAAFGVQVAGVALLRRWAPLWLRPSDADRLAAERVRADRLARSNAIARDLHDSIGHALTAIGIQAEAGVATGAHDPQRATGAFERIRDVANDAVAELDRVLGVLREGAEAATHSGGAAKLQEIEDRFPSGTVELAIDGDSEVMSDEVAETVYRIVQEAVTNGVRHGRPPVRARIDIGARITLEVRNEAAFAAVTGRGRGLAGMRERARLAGGSVTAGRQGSTWVVCADLPRE